MLGIAKKIFGSSNDRKVKDFMSRVQKINALEAKFAALSDDELRMMTDAFRDRMEAGETLDKILNEAFAVAREASRRHAGPAPVRRPAGRRHDPARRRHRRDAHRRGQDPGRRPPRPI
jgi:preprotein translocase subunit SecA